MAFLDIKNVVLRGIAACVPGNVEENKEYEYFTQDEVDRVIASTGIERRHIANPDTTSSDLCYVAAERLIKDLGWEKSEIGCLVYISQTPDFILPPTSCILQHRLELPKECFTIDSSAGCPGWINGMAIISSLLSGGTIKKGLLLVGETPTKYKSRQDKGAWPLFGDAGSATAIEFQEGEEGIKFYLGTDGSNSEAIIVPEGGFRHPFNEHSLEVKEGSDGMKRNGLQSKMDGMSVFTFGIRRGPQSIMELAKHFDINLEEVDYFFIHQANKYMNEKIGKKLHIPAEKMPYTLKDYGNTSCVTIPLTMVKGGAEEVLSSKSNKILACSFGVGLSWGSLYMKTSDLKISILQVI